MCVVLYATSEMNGTRLTMCYHISFLTRLFCAFTRRTHRLLLSYFAVDGCNNNYFDNPGTNPGLGCFLHCGTVRTRIAPVHENGTMVLNSKNDNDNSDQQKNNSSRQSNRIERDYFRTPRWNPSVPRLDGRGTTPGNHDESIGHRSSPQL